MQSPRLYTGRLKSTGQYLIPDPANQGVFHFGTIDTLANGRGIATTALAVHTALGYHFERALVEKIEPSFTRADVEIVRLLPTRTPRGIRVEADTYEGPSDGAVLICLTAASSNLPRQIVGVASSPEASFRWLSQEEARSTVPTLLADTQEAFSALAKTLMVRGAMAAETNGLEASELADQYRLLDFEIRPAVYLYQAGYREVGAAESARLDREEAIARRKQEEAAVAGADALKALKSQSDALVAKPD